MFRGESLWLNGYLPKSRVLWRTKATHTRKPPSVRQGNRVSSTTRHTRAACLPPSLTTKQASNFSTEVTA